MSFEQIYNPVANKVKFTCLTKKESKFNTSPEGGRNPEASLLITSRPFCAMLSAGSTNWIAEYANAMGVATGEGVDKN